MMRLNAGPCLRLGTVRLVALASSLLILPMMLFYMFGPDDYTVSILPSSSTSSSFSPDHYDIPPRPSYCDDLKQDDKHSPRGTARPLSPRALICRDTPSNTSSIPRLFHQSWKSTDLPLKFESWSRTCRDAHPDWEWVLWTDDDNLALVRAYFPHLEQTYTDLPGPIYRADFSRNLYMYMFGGVYADLDLECLRPTEALLPYRITVGEPPDPDSPQHRPLAVLGRLGTDSSFEHSIPNAWMASTPRHPFFLLPLSKARSTLQAATAFPARLWSGTPSAEHITGPIALRDCVLRWKAGLRDLWAEVVLLPDTVIYPFSWKTPGVDGWVCSTMSDRFDAAKCKSQLRLQEKGSLTVTYWSHTHDGAGANAKNIDSVDHDKS